MILLPGLAEDIAPGIFGLRQDRIDEIRLLLLSRVDGSGRLLPVD